MFLSLAMLAAEPLPSVSLSRIEALAPSAAGELVLDGREHERIVAVELIGGGLLPPFTTELALIERPRPVSGGCVRRHWTAVFAETPATNGQRMLDRLYASERIALAPGRGCPATQYAHRNSRMDRGRGFMLLALLEDALRADRKTEFRCSDETGSRLCKDHKTTRAAVLATRPWAVMEENGTAEYWIDEPGPTVLTVRLRPDQPRTVHVLRKIPAPA